METIESFAKQVADTAYFQSIPLENIQRHYLYILDPSNETLSNILEDALYLIKQLQPLTSNTIQELEEEIEVGQKELESLDEEKDSLECDIEHHLREIDNKNDEIEYLKNELKKWEKANESQIVLDMT